ncbi:MAG: hypothetical protein NWE88_13435 [Candidatus Bathyarchaeota archaeon]|nr:hypothetical protein [Candidatus Bathyarchaeota archaeon]
MKSLEKIFVAVEAFKKDMEELGVIVDVTVETVSDVIKEAEPPQSKESAIK